VRYLVLFALSHHGPRLSASYSPFGFRLICGSCEGVHVMPQSAVDKIPPRTKAGQHDNQLFKTRVTPSALDESQISGIIFLDYLPVATGRRAAKRSGCYVR
jgi:hypothetical protein